MADLKKYPITKGEILCRMKVLSISTENHC